MSVLMAATRDSATAYLWPLFLLLQGCDVRTVTHLRHTRILDCTLWHQRCDIAEATYRDLSMHTVTSELWRIGYFGNGDCIRWHILRLIYCWNPHGLLRHSLEKGGEIMVWIKMRKREKTDNLGTEPVLLVEVRF